MGKPKIRPPHRIETPDPIGIKFGTVDYVGEMTPGAKFHVNPSMRSVGDAHWARAVASALGVCLAGIRPEGKVR